MGGAGGWGRWVGQVGGTGGWDRQAGQMGGQLGGIDGGTGRETGGGIQG